MSKPDQKIYAKIYEWRHRPITGSYPYLYLEGAPTWSGHSQTVKAVSTWRQPG